jgi:hypothetical protein
VIPLVEVEKTYLAGIVDGEGTVTLMRHHKNETPVPCVSVANNNLALLQWIKDRLGGHISSKKVYNIWHKKSYVWLAKQDRALRILNEIKKYLLVKKPQADLITEKYKSVTHRAGKYTPEMLKKKMELVAQIRKLNQR